MGEVFDWDDDGGGVEWMETAVILGGRWDGHEVEDHGDLVTYKGGTYVALRRDDGRCFYLLQEMTDEWFRLRR